MKVWAATREHDKIIRDIVIELPTASTEEEWNEALAVICRELDLARPILLKKHLNELSSFRHTAFLPSDFMESVDFGKFTVQLFPEKKKQ